MNTILKTGTDEESLLSVLRDLDENTRVDSVLPYPSDSVSVTIHPQKGKFLWNAELNRPNEQGKSLASGTQFRGLEKCLEELDRTERFDDRFVVLVHLGTEPTRSYDGKYRTTWAKINPSLPYEVKGDALKFDIARLSLSEKELKLCSEREIAFYDEFDDVLYPITEYASDSVGRMMDCQASFKSRSKFPLGSALLLAERLSDAHGLSFITRKGTKHCRPLIGIVGNRFQKYPQAELVEDALDIIRDAGGTFGDTVWPSSVLKWQVFEDRTLTDVAVGTDRDLYRIVITIQTGDVPGYSIQVSAFAVFGEARMLLARNSSYHWKSFQDNGGMRNLFRGIFETVQRFDAEMESLSRIPASEYEFNSEILDPVRKAIGKRNEEEMERRLKEAFSPDDEISSADVVSRICRASCIRRGGEKQEGALESAYSAFFNSFCGKEVLSNKKERKGRRSGTAA